ncbi:MAG: phage baseplate assembly protein V [Methanothrix sp.]
MAGRIEGEPRGSAIGGVVIGIVTNNKDELKKGRVKVKLPIGGEESDWATLAMPMAGKDMGVYLLPEVGDRVLVAFLAGDINYPVVIGSLWDEKNPPPANNEDGKNNLRMIKSRSGHQIILDDDSDGKKEKIEIKTKSGHTILLDDSSGSEKVEIKDKSGKNMLTMDSAKNEVLVSSGGKIIIKDGQGSSVEMSPGKVAVTSKGELSISGQSKIAIKAQIIEIEAGATMTVKSNGPMTIQGAIVKIN